MHFEQRSHYSGQLGREMYFNRYGHAGKPILVFPTTGGTQFEYADFGMIEAAREFIDSGQVHFYTAQSIDHESWNAEGKAAHDKAAAHNQYDKYIIHELIPLIKYESNWQGAVGVTGNSMGGFHTMNFALRHPDVFDLAIALSGVYDARFFTGDFGGDFAVYENSPIDYLYQEFDPWFLDRYRANDYIIAVGQGAWEGPHVQETQRLEAAFNAKGIPAWFDYWGDDVAHDWDWWRIQIRYFLHQLSVQGVI